MKRVIILFISFFIFICNINATSIESINIRSEAEIAGGLAIKEIINTGNLDEDFKLKVYYKDSESSTFDGTLETLNNIYSYGTVTFYESYVINSEVDNFDDVSDNIVRDLEYEIETYDDYYLITLPKIDNNESYYLYYVVNNVLIEHNDCAEMYYKYIYNLDYDVKKIVINNYLAYSGSELFKVYAHSTSNPKVTVDIKNNVVNSVINNYKKGQMFETRILFDKWMFQISINENKRSNLDVVEYITSLEEKDIKVVKTKSNLLLAFIFSVLLLIILVISYIVYKKKHK